MPTHKISQLREDMEALLENYKVNTMGGQKLSPYIQASQVGDINDLKVGASLRIGDLVIERLKADHFSVGLRDRRPSGRGNIKFVIDELEYYLETGMLRKKPTYIKVAKLSDRELGILWTFWSYKPAFRKRVLEHNKVTPEELAEMESKGLLKSQGGQKYQLTPKGKQERPKVSPNYTWDRTD